MAVQNEMRLLCFILIFYGTFMPFLGTSVVEDCGACNNCIMGNTQHIFDASHQSSILEKVYCRGTYLFCKAVIT